MCVCVCRSLIELIAAHTREQSSMLYSVKASAENSVFAQPLHDQYNHTRTSRVFGCLSKHFTELLVQSNRECDGRRIQVVRALKDTEKRAQTERQRQTDRHGNIQRQTQEERERERERERESVCVCVCGRDSQPETEAVIQT